MTFLTKAVLLKDLLSTTWTTGSVQILCRQTIYCAESRLFGQLIGSQTARSTLTKGRL